MKTFKIRKRLANLYDGDWPCRVLRMNEKQLIAIFLKAFKKDSQKKYFVYDKPFNAEKEYQITIWDILIEKRGQETL